MLAVDGFSHKIVGLITLPVKNAVAIYHALMRPLLISEGLWEQVRVDHGTEFCLLVAIEQFSVYSTGRYKGWKIFQIWMYIWVNQDIYYLFQDTLQVL